MAMQAQAATVTQEVGALIDKLAAKLSVPAAHLWQILVKQAQVEAAFAALWIVAYAVLLYVTWAVLRPKLAAWKAADKSYLSDREVGWMFFVLGAVAFTCVGGGFAIAGAKNILVYLLNPEYAALQQIVAALK